MSHLTRFLDWTGHVTWWLSRLEARRGPAPRRPLLGVEELEERVVPTLLGQQLFPADYPWNQNIANAPVAANSAAVITHIGAAIGIHPDWGNDDPSNGDSPLYGIPYNVVPGNSTATVNVIIDNYPGESDIVPVPIPANAVIEGDYQNGPNPNGGGYNSGQRGDSHLIVWDEDNNIAYELFGVTRPTDPTLFPNTDGVELAHTDDMWHAAQETVWNMNTDTFRTLGATSADAAGLSILAGLARPDEGLPVSQGGQGAIDHALRFTLPSRDVNPQYIYPASHMVSDSSGANNLPFGARLRLADTPAVNAVIDTMDPEAQIIAHAMQQYGLVLADIGSPMYVTGASAAVDANNDINLTWNMDDVLGLEALKASDFQVVNLTPVVTGLSTTSGAAGSTITINGQNFSGSAGHLAVFFGSAPATSVTYVNDTQITAIVPGGSGFVNVTVQSGIDETDTNSDNPNADAIGPIFGYGTSAISSADLFTFGSQTVSGTKSKNSFAAASVVAGATDVLTIVVVDTAGHPVGGLNSSAFAFSLTGGTGTGTFGPVIATATAGTYTTTFTAATSGTASTLTTTVTGVALSTLTKITVSLAAPTVLGPIGLIAAANGFDRPTFSWAASPGAGHYRLAVVDKNTGTDPIVVPNINGTTYVPTLSTQALTPGHTFTIDVYAYSANGLTYKLATQTFTLAALTAPTGLTPSGTIAAGSGFDLPTFNWNASPGVGHYRLAVEDDNIGAKPIIVPSLSGTSYVPTLLTQALTPGHTFTIDVYAYSTNSKAYKLATQTFALAPLTPPTLTSPLGTIATPPATFAWSPVAGADHYYLYVVDDTTGTAIINNATITTTSFSPIVPLKPGHKYTWRIAAKSTNNHFIIWSVSQIFTIT